MKQTETEFDDAKNVRYAWCMKKSVEFSLQTAINEIDTARWNAVQIKLWNNEHKRSYLLQNNARGYLT